MKKFLCFKENGQSIARIMFFLFSFFLLGVVNSDLFYRLHLNNYFIFDTAYFSECITQPAGLLIYIARLLLQLFYYPLLGAFVVSILLLALEKCVSKAFSIPKEAFFISFVPSSLILLSVNKFDYSMYDTFDGSFIFSLALGFLFVIGTYVLYQKCKNSYVKFSFYLLLALLYPFVGVYIPLLFILIAFENILCANLKRLLSLSVFFLFLLFAGFGMAYLYEVNDISFLWSPWPTTEFFTYLTGGLLVALSIFLLPFFSRIFVERKLSLRSNFILVFILMLLPLAISFSNRNLRLLAKMQNKVENQDWKAAAQTSLWANVNTRPIMAYRAISLANDGNLDKLFICPSNYENVVCDTMSEKMIYYPDLFFYSSLIKGSYSWSLMAEQKRGVSFAILKNKVQCALVSGDMDSAKSDLERLKKTFFFRSWAKDIEKLMNDKQLLLQHPLYGEIIKNRMDEDSTSQISFLDAYKKQKNLTSENARRKVFLSLYKKDPKEFLMEVPSFGRIFPKEVPGCVKEALCMFLPRESRNLIWTYKVDPRLYDKVMALNEEFQQLSLAKENSKEIREDMKRIYNGLYCYYFLCSNNINININEIRSHDKVRKKGL